MYTMQFDLMDASRVYIYEDTERGLRHKLIVYNDPDLAHELVEYLNRDIAKGQNKEGV